MSREFGKRDKKVVKMSKDGLVEQNLATGEQERISQRGQDFNIRDGQAEPTGRTSGSGGRHEPTKPTRQADYRPTPDAPASGHPHVSEDFSSRSSDDRPRTSQEPPSTASTQKRSITEPSRYAQESSEHPAQSFSSDSAVPQNAPKQANTDTAQHNERAPTSEHRERLRVREGADSSAPSSTPKPKQRGTKYAQHFSQEAAQPDSQADTPAHQSPLSPAQMNVPSASDPAKPSRLQFGKEETTPGSDPSPDKKLNRARYKAESVNEKLEQAKEKLPQKRVLQKKRVYDEQKGKAKTKFQFEKQPLQRGEAKFKPPAIVRKPAAAVKSASGAAGRTVHGKLHQKIYQVEDENVGIKAAHRAEMLGEKGLRMSGRAVGKTYRFVKDAPYRTVAKLEKQAVKANVKFSYRKALAENPQLRSNVVSRFMQKQKIKRTYAKAAREAKKAGGKAAKKTGSVIGRAAKAVAGFVKRHPMVAGIVALIMLLLFFITTMLGSCSNMASGIMASVVTSSYVAEDADIDNAELAYSEWETDLLMEAQNAESSHPGYDEYKYEIDDVSHDPFELMAYLTAMYQDFQFADVQAALRQIFEEQYNLTFEPEVEIRTRTVTKYRSVYDDDGTYLGEEEYEDEEEYEWHILNVKLTSRSFSDVVAHKMNADQSEMFEVYMQTKGNRQYLINPFAFNWLPYVSDYYGWRVHPITGEKDYHKGIDIAVPAGTEILAGHDGVVTQAANAGGYGLVVTIENDKGLVSKYAHCSELLVSVGQEVKKGDVIAKVGSTGDSTGPHLHLEIIKNGQYLNPIFFGETGDDGSGRIPPGSPGGVDIPDYPGEPITDGDYAALIAEAEKHIGKPYVFGAKGPDKFDCSGFVSWALTHSGVKSISTNAQGLYNACTPVSAANVKPGDLIFFQGTYSTSNTVTHVGIYVGNGMMLHAGKPVQYTSINTNYWNKHFYAYGRY